jgi:hypothetical protein
MRKQLRMVSWFILLLQEEPAKWLRVMAQRVAEFAQE